MTDSADQARTVGAGCRWLHVTGRGDQSLVVGADVCGGVRTVTSWLLVLWRGGGHLLHRAWPLTVRNALVRQCAVQ